MVETYLRDIFQAGAEAMGGGGSEGGDTKLIPLDPECLARKAISVKDREVFHPAPMEDGASRVAGAKIWARVQATVRKRRRRSKRSRKKRMQVDMRYICVVMPALFYWITF